MTGSRKVLLIIAALGLAAYCLPVTRDELSWWWAESHNHSDSYFLYLTHWPKGRHIVEARLFCLERQRAEATRADIRKVTTMLSMASPSDPGTEAAYRREVARRKDNFFWKRATNLDTSLSYQDYLKQFPAGLHASSARQRIQSLGRSTKETSALPQ